MPIDCWDKVLRPGWIVVRVMTESIQKRVYLGVLWIDKIESINKVIQMRIHLRVSWPSKIGGINRVIWIKVYLGVPRPDKFKAMRVHLKVPRLEKIGVI